MHTVLYSNSLSSYMSCRKTCTCSWLHTEYSLLALKWLSPNTLIYNMDMSYRTWKKTVQLWAMLLNKYSSCHNKQIKSSRNSKT